ncbi:DUF2851 family protein [Deminuibacter soli]|uniref:DUF2851 family protein n=1 Tax=Deminuibacter soli TaxID=2291815 RepID=A0A3E1NH08_9BACT|nr:DUF2851 family protein [Deminuibacter soli]
MTERLLQFIWQYQYFSKQSLVTTDGEPLQLIHTGTLNTNQGPDFTNARLRIGSTLWAGNVELHVRASEWHQHAHSGDVHYDNVILHVVWEQDTIITDNNGEPLPALELQPRVSSIMLQQYIQLMESKDFVPCAAQLPVLSPLAWLSWKERLAAERLQRKAAVLAKMLQGAANHWEEVFWWLLARNFGMKVNGDCFEGMARSLPVNLLSRHKIQIHQVEALLLGQAGMLEEDFAEAYPKLLQREYRYLRKKYQLQPIRQTPSLLRMRPANFPAVRLAQLAMLIHQSVHLFAHIRDTPKLSDVQTLFNVTANDYWHYHYRLNEPAGNCAPKKLGNAMTGNLVINTVVPVLFAYGLSVHDEELKQRAIQWLAQVAPEQNNITTEWKRAGVTNYNALDSQALIELKNNYCDKRNCLQCPVGNQLLKNV